MNEVEKINAVVNELGSIYKLTLEQTNLIKSNIMKRSELYKNIKPTINPNETAFIKNTSTITDILLNRLINNIRVYDFRDNYNMSVKEKGTYAANSQTLTLEGNQFLYDVTYKKLKERNPNITEDIVKKASEKVKNHEFGHALQTSFNGIEGMYNEKLIQVINNLNIKYPSIFKNYNDLSKNKLNKIHGGLVQSILNKVETEEEKIKNYYGRFAKFNFGEHNIDEIFNDDEAISISDMNNPQFEYNY